MVYVFLADGFEEVEALTPIDMLRRVGVEVVTAGIGKIDIIGAHDITVKADILASDVALEAAEMIVLPGGWPGTPNLQANADVQKAIDTMVISGGYIAAICAAPMILGEKGLLKGRKATCFSGFEDKLIGADVTGEPVCVDGNVITARSAGVALDFAFELVRVLKDEQTVSSLKEKLLCR